MIDRLIAKLEQASSEAERDQLIITLAKLGEPAIDALLDYTKEMSRQSPFLVSVVRVLARAERPLSARALEFLVALASSANAPASEAASELLVCLGQAAILPIRDALSYYSQDCNEYAHEIQGLCAVLATMRPSEILPLLPQLLEVLGKGSDENFVDVYVLWPLRRIESPEAEAAVPMLARNLASSHKEYRKVALLESLSFFSPSVVSKLRAQIEDALGDESPRVRTKAREVLAGIAGSDKDT